MEEQDKYRWYEGGVFSYPNRRDETVRVKR